jgi:hypothetical protein
LTLNSLKAFCPLNVDASTWKKYGFTKFST